MTPGRVLGAILAVWFLGLAVVLQPKHHGPPRVLHARPLDPTPQNLPTLPP